VAGNVGSSKKLEHTVIGDAVNVSRLPTMTKEVGHPILANAETADAAMFEEVVEVDVRGRVKKARVFVVGEALS
jgi:adenylate cyclase